MARHWLDIKEIALCLIEKRWFDLKLNYPHKISIIIYVNTKDGIEICDCFSDIQLEMEEESLNFKDKEVVLKFLKKKYNI